MKPFESPTIFCVRLIALMALIMTQFFGGAQPALAASVPVITEGDSIAVTMDTNGDPTPFSLTLNATDSDGGDTLTWSISAPATHGTANVSGVPTGNSQVISYAPSTDYVGTDSFVVQVADGVDGTDTITVNVSIYYAPVLASRLTDNRVVAYDWPDGTLLALTIDDPATLPISDFTATVTAKLNNPADPFSGTLATYELGSAYILKPGDVVTADGNGITRTMTVADLQVTDVDKDTDSVSGTAGAGIDQVSVRVWTTPADVVVTAPVTSSAWVADFSAIYDLQPGDNGIARWWDANGNMTSDYWVVPNPYVEARANEEVVNGWDFLLGSTVTIDISRPGATISRTAVVGMVPWDPRTNFQYNFKGEFDLQVGDLISVTDGVTTKTMTVTNLTITNVDLVTDMVTGVATAGANVSLWACIGADCSFNRHVTANGAGVWQADFSHVGVQPDEQTIANLGLGTWIDSSENDIDRDSTMYGIQIPSPFVEASAKDNWVHAREWPKGTLLTLQIDDLSNGLGSVDYTTTATMDQSPWNPGDPNDIIAIFDLGTFKVAAGDVLTVSGNVFGLTATKVLTISSLAITTFGLAADTISGVASLGGDVEVCLNIPGSCISRLLTADAVDGTWTADYSSEYDLVPGDGGWAIEYEADADRTWYDWYVSSPFIEANVKDQWVRGREWLAGTLVTMDIDDLSNGLGGVDYTRTAIMAQAPWNLGDPNDIVADFDMDGFTLAAGDVITMLGDLYGNPFTKVLTVSNVAVTAFDLAADAVSGVATPGAEVEVCANPNNCISRFVSAAGDGTWTANYAPEHDLISGDSGWAMEWDADADRTQYDWYVLNPRLDVWFLGGEINAYDWPLGSQVTLTIDDPATPSPSDYPDTLTVVPANWDPEDQTLAQFVLGSAFTMAPGMIVTVTGSSITRQMTILPLSVTSLDLDRDTITGQTAPNQNMWMWFDSSCCRGFQSNASGIWTVDYSVPGPGGEKIADLDVTSGGTINASDTDGDNTSLNWNAAAFLPMTVAIVPASTGSGVVTSDLPGISCGADCKESYFPNTSVTLTATPAVGSTFMGWGGGTCSGTAPCIVSMTAAVSVTAEFVLSEYTLTITSAHGTVTKNPDQATYHYGAVVQLTVAPSAGWLFKDWTGALTGAANPASVTLLGNTALTANYYALSVLTVKSTGTTDGWLLESSEKSNKGGTFNNLATTFRLGDDATKKQYRGLLSFSTGVGLPDNAFITKVTLKVKRQGVTGGGNPVKTFQGFLVDIKKGYLGTTALQPSDFQAKPNQTYGPFTPVVAGGWYSLDLTPGKDYINKLSASSGLTQIRLRFKLDDNNNTVANTLNLFSGNAVLGSRPQLLIEYYIP